jgi:hypothetical protein
MEDVMRFGVRLVVAAVLSAVAAAPAFALTLFASGSDTLKLADPVALGRLTRDGVPSDWSASKAFPGVISPTTVFHYTTFVVPVTNTPFIQISVDDPDTVVFAAAYLDNFNPPNFSTNYLGDAGSSGNQFGNPGFFQVVVPVGHDLVLVVEETTAPNGGLGHPFDVLVEGFIDAEFTDPTAAVPEPSTWAMMLLGFAGLGFAFRQSQRKVMSPEPSST